jgi:hypothetical protein
VHPHRWSNGLSSSVAILNPQRTPRSTLPRRLRVHKHALPFLDASTSGPKQEPAWRLPQIRTGTGATYTPVNQGSASLRQCARLRPSRSAPHLVQPNIRAWPGFPLLTRGTVLCVPPQPEHPASRTLPRPHPTRRRLFTRPAMPGRPYLEPTLLGETSAFRPNTPPRDSAPVELPSPQIAAKHTCKFLEGRNK